MAKRKQQFDPAESKYDYPVGKCKPPAQYRWQKGQPSPNPGGRPKRARTFIDEVWDIVYEGVRVSDAKGVKNIPLLFAALKVNARKALQGDLRALKLLLLIADRLDVEIKKKPEIVIRKIERVLIDPLKPGEEMPLPSGLYRLDSDEPL